MLGKRRGLRAVALGVAGVLSFLVIWQLAPRSAGSTAPTSRRPPRCWRRLGQFTLDLNYWRTIGNTLLTWAIGLAIAVVPRSCWAP